MRFRFRIRDLLWLAALVAIGMAWWADRRQLAEANEQLTLLTPPFAVMESVKDPNRKEAVKTLKEAYKDRPSMRFIDKPANDAVLLLGTCGEVTAVQVAIGAMTKNAKPAAAEASADAK
jgi:hypothetical protein